MAFQSVSVGNSADEFENELVLAERIASLERGELGIPLTSALKNIRCAIAQGSTPR